MRGREENYPSKKSEALDEGGAQTPVIQAFLYFVRFWGGDRPQETTPGRAVNERVREIWGVSQSKKTLVKEEVW